VLMRELRMAFGKWRRAATRFHGISHCLRFCKAWIGSLRRGSREAHRKTKPPNRLGLAAFTKTDAEIIPRSSNRPRDAPCAGVLAGDPTALHREPPSPRRESPVWVNRVALSRKRSYICFRNTVKRAIFDILHCRKLSRSKTVSDAPTGQACAGCCRSYRLIAQSRTRAIRSAKRSGW
jgi:hypothetical protein